MPWRSPCQFQILSRLERRRISSPDRPPVRPNPHLPAQPELLGGAPKMALGAEAADVTVLVRSAMGERHNVVRHGRLADNPGGGTITAERFGAKTAKSLGDPASSTKSMLLIASLGMVRYNQSKFDPGSK